MRTLAFLGALVFFGFPSEAQALVRCGVTKDDRAFTACPTSPPHVVADSVFLEDGTLPGGIADGLPPNPAFAATFDVFTCYDYGDPDYWGPEELRLFASYVLSGTPADAEGLAVTILDFFAENSPDPSHPVRIDLGSSVMETFEIHIHAGAAEIGAADNKLSVDIVTYGNTLETPFDVAHAGFTHEWQHVCDAWYSRDGYTESDFPASSIRFGEIASVLSEWLFGLDGMEGIGDFEIAYDQSLVKYAGSERNYHAQCLCNDDFGYCCPYFGIHPYVQFSLLGIYLHNRLPHIGLGSESFFQDWLHKLDGTTYMHDLRGLAELLEDDACDGLFPDTSTGNGRLKEMVHAWEAAKFLNWTGGSGEDDLLQWQHDSALGGDHRTPQLFNLFRTPDSICWNDIEATPPYHVLGSGQSVSHEGFLKYSDLFGTAQGCDALGDEGEYLYHRRFVEVSSFAANYIVLFPTSGSTAEFVFSPSVTYACADCSHESQPEDLFHTMNGPLEVDITPYGLANLPPWSFDPVGGRYLDEAVNQPGVSVFKLQSLHIPEVELGRDYLVSVDLDEHGLDAVVFVISCVDPVCDDGDMIAEFVPYSYSLAVDPTRAYLPSFVNSQYEMGPGTTRWLGGEVLVDNAGALVLGEGARLFAETEAAHLTISGTLQVLGSPTERCQVAASPDPEDGVESWLGITASASGSVAIENTELSGLGVLDLTAMSADAEITGSTLIFDGSATAKLSTPRPGSVSIDGTYIGELNHIEMRDGTITSSMLRQRESVLPLVKPEPFLRIEDAQAQIQNASLIESIVLAVDVPVRIGGTAYPVHATLTGDSLWIYGDGLESSKPTGLLVKSNADVDAYSLGVNPGSLPWMYYYGARIEGNGSLTLRGSRVSALKECISTSSGSAAVDLGHDTEDWGFNKIWTATEKEQYCRKLCVGPIEGCEEECCEAIVGAPGKIIFNRSSNSISAQGNSLPEGLTVPPPSVCFDTYIKSLVPGTEVVAYPRWGDGQPICIGPWGPGCPPGGGFSIVSGTSEAERPRLAVRNPSFGGITIFSPSETAVTGVPFSVLVYDVAGRRVLERRGLRFEPGGGGRSEMRIAPAGDRLASGVYLVRVTWPGGVQTQKTIVLE